MRLRKSVRFLSYHAKVGKIAREVKFYVAIFHCRFRGKWTRPQPGSKLERFILATLRTANLSESISRSRGKAGGDGAIAEDQRNAEFKPCMYFTTPIPISPSLIGLCRSALALAVLLHVGAHMFGLLKSMTDLAGDVATVALAPVEIVVDLAGAATKPLAEAVKELAADVKILKD